MYYILVYMHRIIWECYYRVLGIGEGSSDRGLCYTYKSGKNIINYGWKSKYL